MESEKDSTFPEIKTLEDVNGFLASLTRLILHSEVRTFPLVGGKTSWVISIHNMHGPNWTYDRRRTVAHARSDTSLIEAVAEANRQTRQYIKANFLYDCRDPNAKVRDCPPA